MDTGYFYSGYGNSGYGNSRYGNSGYGNFGCGNNGYIFFTSTVLRYGNEQAAYRFCERICSVENCKRMDVWVVVFTHRIALPYGYRTCHHSLGFPMIFYGWPLGDRPKRCPKLTNLRFEWKNLCDLFLHDRWDFLHDIWYT